MQENLELTQSDRQQLIDELHRIQAVIRASKLHGAGLIMDVDLTIPQLRMLLQLRDSGPLTMGGLSTKLGVTLSACTHLVDKLVRSQLAERTADLDDRRVVHCSITDQGSTLVERLRQSLPFERPEFTEQMTDAELRTVVEAMTIVERVVCNMQDRD